MLNLKGAYDVVIAAETAWKQKAAEIAALFDDGKEAEALALQGSLDDLQADYEAKKALYDKLVQTNSPGSVNQLFVPASPTQPDGEEKPKGVMKRSEFHALSNADRMAFCKAGGRLED